MSGHLQQRPTREHLIIPIERLPGVLRGFRLSRGLSRLDAARAAGLALGGLLNLESRVEGARVSPLSQLLCALGYSLSELQAALDQAPDSETWDANEPPDRDGRRRFPQSGKHLFPLELLGPALTEMRITAGLTQTALARESGIPQTQLSRYEVGGQSPLVLTLCKLLGVLGCTLTDLERVIGYLRLTVPPARR